MNIYLVQYLDEEQYDTYEESAVADVLLEVKVGADNPSEALELALNKYSSVKWHKIAITVIANDIIVKEV